MTVLSTVNEITTGEFDQRFDNGEEVMDYVDMTSAVVRKSLPRNDSQRPINTSLPAWLVDFLDDEASRRGINRKAVINDWLVDRADQELARRKAIDG